MVSFFGINPVIKESGDGKKHPKMSKKGSSYMRSLLYMAALNAVRSDDHLRKIYEEAIENGMGKKAALGKIMQKILRIIYGILKTKQNQIAQQMSGLLLDL